MFISVLDLFKIGIGPSSSHTLGPMIAASVFLSVAEDYLSTQSQKTGLRLTCTLKGSLSFTGKGHATDKAVVLGLNGHLPIDLVDTDTEAIIRKLNQQKDLSIAGDKLAFDPLSDVIFDKGKALPQHPNGLIFQILDDNGELQLEQTYFSIGGGFIKTLAELEAAESEASQAEDYLDCRFPFDSASSMLAMTKDSGYSIAEIKRINEQRHTDEERLNKHLDEVWTAMQQCIHRGLETEGVLPGSLKVSRRAKSLFEDYQGSPKTSNINDWLCAYAMAVNEENAAGHMVVTAPTNGAAGVVPAVLYYFVKHEEATLDQVYEFLLTAAAIGGLIKHRSSISGAEVGCQGEVGSAAAMAAAGLCAAKGGTPEQVENAAEIALEHHLGMTCDPVAGLVQIPCIERNGFGAIKAYTASALALRGNGSHVMPLDSCIAAMHQTGMEMSSKFKETSLGGLAVSITEC